MSIVVALLLAPAPVAEAITFPKAFHGVWDTDAEACAGSHNDGRITIKSKEVVYWESGGVPTGIVTAGERDIRVTLAMSGEGEEWKSHTRFVIDQSGTTLFSEQLPQAGEEYSSSKWFYTRCPSSTKFRP